MVNLNKMLKQAKQMQSQMTRMQDELARMELSYSAGGGAVEVVARGDQSVVSIKIKPEVVDPADVEGLEDLVLTAVNGALNEVKRAAKTQLSQVTGGLNIPGL
jgi:DNA-binding YbaB/EbfC family protein